MVSTCVFLALLLPLLVKAAGSENGNVYFDPIRGSYRDPDHGSVTQPPINPDSAHNQSPLERPPSPADPGDRGPLHASAPKPPRLLVQLATQSDEDLMAILDKRFSVDVLPPGANYRIRGSTDPRSLIPTQDYYRHSPKTVIETLEAGEYEVDSKRLFRSHHANIPRERLEDLFLSQPIHTLPIRHLLAKIPTNYDNDDSLKVSVFPLGSHWYLPPNPTHSHTIADNEYIQVPPFVDVVTRVGTFQLSNEPFVRTAEYRGIDEAAFERFKRECKRSYERIRRGRTDSTFVERCTKNTWKRVVRDKGPPKTYRTPVFKPDLPS